MFDELLSQMEDAISTAKKIKGPKKSERQIGRNQGGIIDCTKTFGKVATFSKSDRFKVLEKEPLKTSHIQWPHQQEKAMAQSKKFSFNKNQRFAAEKPKYTDTYINPDIATVKRNTKNNVPIYKEPSPSKQLAQSKVSVSTVDSEVFRAPGLYNPKEESKVKQGVIGKDSRFKQQKSKYHDVPLFVNQNQTKKRPPTATVMKKKTKKTANLISRDMQEELREKMKLIYWKNIPLEMDRIFKDRRGAIIRDNYFDLGKLSGTAKRSAILMLLDRMNMMRGGYQYETSGKMEAPCGVVYRKSTPKPFKFSQMDPGPDYYYPLDDYVRADQVAFSFGRQGMRPKIVEGDLRDYEIKEEIMKKGGNIVINPVHREVRLTDEEISDLQRGPGFYDCLFSQVEKRADIGVVKMQEITDKNDRQNNCIQIPEVNDGIYYPSYKAMDPNVAVPLLKQPANVKPMHMPQKDLFPEHWLFYDGDLKKVRAEIAKNIIMGNNNMSFEDYREYRQKFKRFKEYLEIQRKQPEVGQYEVSYKAIDAHVAVVDFQKQPEKDPVQGYKKPQGDVDGDNLILNPKQFEPHLANIDFKKMEGREEMEVNKDEEPRIGDRLLLEPKKIEKHIANVIFDKQAGRPEPVEYGEEDAGPEGDVLRLDPKPIGPHIAQVDFEKQAERPQIRIEQDQNEVVNFLEPKVDPPKIKGVPFSRLTSVKLVPLLRQSKLGKQQQQM